MNYATSTENKNRVNALKVIKSIFSPRQVMPVWENYLVTPTHIERSGQVKKSPFTAQVMLFSPTAINRPILLKEVDSDAYTVDATHASYGGVKCTYIDANEYPDTFPGLITEISSISITSDQWARISKIAEAISNDDTRYNLQCLLISKDCEVVATDGHAMSFTTIAPIGKLSADLLIPGQIVKALKKASVTCIQRIGEEHGMIQGELYGIRFEVVYRYESMPYPDWKQVLPKKSGHRTSLQPAPLISALQQVEKNSTDKRPSVKLSFSDAGMKIEHKDASGSFDALLPIIDNPYAGKPIELQTKYLLMALKDSKGIDLEIHGEFSPFFVHGDLCTSLVMPLRY